MSLIDSQHQTLKITQMFQHSPPKTDNIRYDNLSYGPISTCRTHGSSCALCKNDPKDHLATFCALPPGKALQPCTPAGAVQYLFSLRNQISIFLPSSRTEKTKEKAHYSCNRPNDRSRSVASSVCQLSSLISWQS